MTTDSPSRRHRLRSLISPLVILIIIGLGLFLLWRSQNSRGFSTRALVAKTVTELRILDQAIEAYRADNGALPPMVPFDPRDIPTTHSMMTTVDLALISVTPIEGDRVQFGPPDEGEPGYTYGNFEGYSGPPDLRDWGTASAASRLRTANPYLYFAEGEDFLLLSAGTDWDCDINLAQIQVSPEAGFSRAQLITLGTYDATNGANSDGDIWRASRDWE